MPCTLWTRVKPIAGAALVACGGFLLCDDLDRLAIQVGHVVDAFRGDSLGVLSFILDASQVWQSYAVDHHRFLQALLQNLLVSSWPLLLVVLGTAWSRDPSPQKGSGVR
jgi:hypothetical protein